MHGMYAGKERRNRMVALVLALVLLAGVVLALVATVTQAAPAQALPAHASLVSIVPADGAELSSAPTQIQLTFDDTITPQFSQVRLTRDGTPVETAPPSVAGTVLTATVTEKAGPGAYRVAWQVTSDDGHPVSGESSFTVKGGAAGTPGQVRALPSEAGSVLEEPVGQGLGVDHPSADRQGLQRREPGRRGQEVDRDDLAHLGHDGSIPET